MRHGGFKSMDDRDWRSKYLEKFPKPSTDNFVTSSGWMRLLPYIQCPCHHQNKSLRLLNGSQNSLNPDDANFWGENYQNHVELPWRGNRFERFHQRKKNITIPTGTSPGPDVALRVVHYNREARSGHKWWAIGQAFVIDNPSMDAVPERSVILRKSHTSFCQTRPPPDKKKNVVIKLLDVHEVLLRGSMADYAKSGVLVPFLLD